MMHETHDACALLLTNCIKEESIMKQNPRCLYSNSFSGFVRDSELTVLGELVDRYHGEVRTTTIEAWRGEIDIMRDVLSRFQESDGRIIFEYDIPRLGKRIDVVLLLMGIINWQSANKNPRDKRKELCSQPFGLKYTWNQSTSKIERRQNVNKLILFLDGTWTQEDLNALIQSGWDEIYYPDEIDKLKASIV